MAYAEQRDRSGFAYEAISTGGQRIIGTIHAATHAQVSEILQSLPLRSFVLVPPTDRGTHPPDTPTRTLPDELALQTAAEGMHSRRLAKATRALARQLRAGQTMPDALRATRGFTRRQRRFLSNAQPAVTMADLFLQLDSYQVAIRRIRLRLYAALAYPLVLLTAMVTVFSVVGLYTIPKFRHIFQDFRTSLPSLTEWCIDWSDALPGYLCVFASMIVAFFFVWIILGLFENGRRGRDYVVSYCPLWGSIWRASVIARWCNAVALALKAGQSPADAIAWAGSASRCALIRAEGLRLAGMLLPDRPLDRPLPGRMIDSNLSSAIALAVVSRDLPDTLQRFATMYEKEFATRRAELPLLIPMAIGVTVMGMFVLVISMFLPLVKLIQSVS